MPQATLEVDTDELEADPENLYFCTGHWCLNILNEPKSLCLECQEEMYWDIWHSERAYKHQDF